MKIDLLRIGKALGSDVSLALAQSPAFAALHRWYQRSGAPDAVIAPGREIESYLSANARPAVEPYDVNLAFSVPVVLGGRALVVNSDTHQTRFEQTVELIRAMALMVQRAPEWATLHSEPSSRTLAAVLRCATARAEGNALLLTGAVIANVEAQGGLALPRAGLLWPIVAERFDSKAEPATANAEAIMARADVLGDIVVADAGRQGRYAQSIDRYAEERAAAVERMVARRDRLQSFGPDPGQL